MTTELLDCPDEAVRLRAVEALASDAPISLLVRALGDRSWRVRQAAVGVFVHRRGPEAIRAALHAMREDHLDLGVLNSAIQVLTQTGVDTLESLVAFLADADPQLRTCAVLTLGSQADPRAVPALMRALNDPDTNVRYHVIEALGQLRAGVAADALAVIAESRDFSLAFPALDALASIGDSRVAYRLTPLLQDELLQTAALDALGRLGDEEVVAPLTELLNTPGAPTVAVARALAALYDRHEAAYRKGGYIAALARQGVNPTGVRNLLDALDEARGSELQALALVLGWLESTALERTLAQLLGRPASRTEVIEALVRKGPRVTELLIEQLGAEDRETRQAAVLALGRIGDARAVPPLLAALSADEELAVGTAGALAMIGDREAYLPLLGLLGHGDAAVRRAAISALNSLGHPEMGKDIAALLRDPRPLVRESAVKIVGYVGYPDCADLLLECCRDPHEAVRRAAVESLPSLAGAQALAPLSRALKDEAVHVRAAAARALGQVEGEEAWPLLREALDDTAPWVRYYAARSVGRQGYADALDALTKLALADEAMQVRVAAVEAVGHIGGARALPVLISLADASDGDLARAALAALGESGHPDALPPLRAALDSSDTTRRIAALRALGESGRAEAVEVLRQGAACADADLATAAIDALGQSSAPEAVDALIALTVQPARRDACVIALARSGAEHLARLARGLSHEHLDVRRAVVEALARMKDPRATEVLNVALGDAAGSVRLAAITALAHAGDNSGAQRLAALAGNDPDFAVRRAARASLRR